MPTEPQRDIGSTRLPDYDTSDPQLNRLTSDQIDVVQNARLKSMVRYVYARSELWRQRLRQAGINPKTFLGLHSLSDLPFCDKSELQSNQLEAGPFGSYACTRPEEWTRFFATSGTTGNPLFRVFSDRDWRLILGRFNRNAVWRPTDVVLMTAPTDGLIGPTAALESARAAGALVIQAGIWRTSRKISSIQRIRPNVINGTTSYLVHLLEAAKAEGIDLSQCGVERLSCVGEPGAGVKNTKDMLMRGYGAARISDGYGITEIFPLGGNCPFSTELHLSEDMVIVECLEPGTNSPAAAGAPGELVYTNIIGDTQPVLRYRSGDLGVLSERSGCGCGHTHRRIQSIMGRVDDMIWYRGVNFFPSAVEDIVRGFSELSPEYQIRIGEERSLPTITIVVESDHDEGHLKQRVASRIKDGIGILPRVEVAAVGALPRSTDGGKLRRVVDTRNLKVTGGMI